MRCLSGVRWLLIVGSLCGLWATVAAAQETPPEPPKKEAPAPTPEKRNGVAEADVGPIYLREKDGQLVPVPGISLEEFMRRVQQPREGGAPAAIAPVFSLDQLALQGRVEQGKLPSQMTMQARVSGSGWVGIPLRMPKLTLTAAPKYEAGVEQALKWEADGYVWWIKGPTLDKPAVLQLDAVLPLAEVGDETRLNLAFPRANACKLTLAVAGVNWQAAVRSGEGIVSVTERDGNSELQVVGAAGDFQLGWRKDAGQVATPVALLESSGEITVKVEGKSRISSEARLKVRSFGGAVSSFRVRLPPAMELLPFATTGYALHVVEDLPRGPAMNPAALAKASQLIEVKLDRPATGVVEVRLVAVLVPDEKRTAPLEPARFEIIGAVRQRGTLDAIVDGDWTLQWTEDASVRRLESTADGPTASAIAARYEYFRQPCGLKMQVASRPTRVFVEPTYLVHMEKDRLRLEGNFKYRIRGARASQLTLDIGDWSLVSVGPDSLVEIDAAAAATGAIALQLVAAGGATGSLELHVEASRPLPAAGEPIVFALPRPKGDVVSPATLIVLPADNVELTPDAGALQGLAGDTVPAHVTLPARQQPPLVYRDLGGSEPAKFVATARQQARRTLVNSTAALRAGRGSVEVVQKLRYQVQFEGATAFEWWVPDRLAENSAFQVLDEAQQPLECKASADDAPTRDGFRRLRWEAPQPVLGVKEFTVRSLLEIPLATGVLRPTVTAAFLLPIVDPAPSEGVQLTVTQADDVQVEPASSTASLRWERVGGQEFRGALAADVGALDLRVTPLERPRLRGTAVQRMMIQTWLTRHDRQDRVAIRLIAPDSKVRVRLPQGAGISDLIAALDGERWEALRVTDQDEVVVALPESKQGRECVLELWYAFADGRSVHNAIWTRLDPPVIVGATTVRQVMWQVDSPADEHLLCDPSTYVPEMHWLWRGAFFGRESSQTQEQLERWVGASVQQPLPAAENHYLFSSFGRNPILQLALVRRRWLLLVASGAVLLVGTLLIYFPVLRHPAGFLLLGVALVTGALLAPEMAAVAGQGAVLGTVACAITALLRRVWSPPIPAPPIMDRSRRARPDSVVERPSTPGSRSGITTTAAPAYVGPESHP